MKESGKMINSSKFSGLGKAAFMLAAAVFVMGAILHPAMASDAPGVKLSWNAPKDVAADKIAGYNIYRSDSILGHYTKVNKETINGLVYEDRGLDEAGAGGLERGRMYYYRVTSILKDGVESNPSNPIGMAAGGSPDAQAHVLPNIEFFTSDALGRVIYLDEDAVFILKGTPGLEACFRIVGVTENIKMDEVQPGTYKGSYTVPPDARISRASAVAELKDSLGGRTIAETGAGLNMLGWKRPTLTGLYAGIVEADRVGLNWPRQEGIEGTFSIFRNTSPIVGMQDALPITGNLGDGISAYIDGTVAPGVTYYYVLALVDGEGFITAYSDNLKVVVPEAGRVSGIDSVSEDSGGRTLVPGDTLGVSMTTEQGGEAFFSLGDAVRDIPMQESEPGVYAGSYKIREGDGVFKSRVAVSFRDARGRTRFSNSATFVSVNAPRTKPGSQPGDGTRPAVYALTDDIQSVVGPSGRLTAGKTFTVTMTGEPGNKAFFSVGESIWKVPMEEDEGQPGTYTGAYTVRPGDNAGTSGDPLAEVYVTGYLESASGVSSEPVTGAMPVIIDTTCNIAVDVSGSNLPADGRSQAKVTFTVTDADREPVKDRRLTLLLEPPPKYTGVVGGGGMVSYDPDRQDAADGALGRLEADFDDLTDVFGRITATYTSGYAAKTAMIVARDYSTGSVGMGYITTELSSSVSLLLEDPAMSSGAGDAAPPIYELVVEVVPEDPVQDIALPYFMVDAIPDRLTADGRSRASIVATLTKDGVPVEGRSILFAVTGAGGSLTASGATTDIMGRAQVFYIAGTKAGRALITATEAETGVSVTKTITLLADAPAKIIARAMPDTLPADGISVSRIFVGVMDVNDNPTEGIRLSYDLPGGLDSGSLSEFESVTDMNGETSIDYTAGLMQGVVTINITAVSEPPSAEELDRARSIVAAPLVYDFSDFTELSVIKWYRAVGDLVGRGEPLALVQTPLGEMKVYSPVTGTLEEIIIDSGVYVMEGREIGVIKSSTGL